MAVKHLVYITLHHVVMLRLCYSMVLIPLTSRRREPLNTFLNVAVIAKSQWQICITKIGNYGQGGCALIIPSKA